MSDIAIKFENISKQYRLGLVGTGTISHDLNRWWHVVRGKEDPYLKIGEVNDRSSKANSKYVWALKDITFDVKQGEVLGIIGKNGAGKSTLLKILSRVTSPTTGTIKAKGRIASLLEVGTGFHPEMTGRENIFMNGSIMGMTKTEIKSKLDEIVDFAGVEKYIDTPVKRYSSGMTVRLGFAIAAHLEPEILVVDEVLAVGDAEFQKKAIGKMQDVSRGQGRTVLFVSHNMATLKNLCHNGVLLKDGQIEYQSDINDVIEKYISAYSFRTSFDPDKKRDGSGKAKVINLRLLNETTKEEVSTYKMGEDILVEVQIEAREPIPNLDVNIRLNNLYNVSVAAWRTKETCADEQRYFDKGIHSVFLKIKDLNVFDGKYNLSYSLFEGNEMLDFMNEAIDFEIIPEQIPIFSNQVVSKSFNLIYTPCEWYFNTKG